MNWSAIGAIGEIIGAIAVVASLGYLAVQVRQNTKMMKAQTRDSVSTKQMQIATYVFQEPSMAEIIQGGLRGEYEQQTPEHLKFGGFLTANLREWENSYHQYKAGLFEHGDFEARQVRWKQLLQFKTIQARWEQDRETYGPEFRTVIDDLVQDAKRNSA